ncbi:hypothetical protein DYB37_010894 [Aphanomyces astaci]|uniref:Uncharacterized protein n=1 Tax=Aphanomyces astaci TaxID=112090 RepID=A0A3R6XPK3_APHAT|nr:hypothetical protein DYB35_013421 [Aphanomyces astaci]RHZ28614.1 hypothetical protein DYB37_010894 [Aphanomyces astaci]
MKVWNAPAIPQPTKFSGSTKAERRAFMVENQKILGQFNAMQCIGSRRFAMPVSGHLLRQLAASCSAGNQLYVGLDDVSKPSPAAKPVEALRGGKPQVLRRDGVQLENIVCVDDVVLDFGRHTRVQRLSYPYGNDAEPVVMKRRVKFNCVTLDTTCGPLVLRGLKAWVDDASTTTEVIVSRPVMKLLGFSDEDLLDGARKKKGEWDK